MTTSGGVDTSPSAVANWSEADETARQLRRFVVVGLVCVVADLSVYTALTDRLGIQPTTAKAISYLAGVAVGFGLNKRWTFRSSRRTWREPISYLLLYAATLGINVACNNFILALLPNWRLLAFLFATGVTTVINFVGMRLVTFRKGIAERRPAIDVEQPQSKAA